MEPQTSGAVTTRALEVTDLDEADRIMRVAFGTFLGMPDPTSFMGDADYVHTRWAAEPSAAIAAEVDGQLVGSNFATRWGSVGCFGPLTVSPELWDNGVARALLDRTMQLFDEWGVRHRGLFTFAQSPKHLGLYGRYGFLPRFLTSVMAKPVEGTGTKETILYSVSADQDQTIAECAALTTAIYPGLEVTREIRAVESQRLGDTVLVMEGAELEAFAVCHVGAGTEAGSGVCFIKFGAARPGHAAADRFASLLGACEAFAAAKGAGVLSAGVSTSRRGAYQALIERGYRARSVGVTMHQPDEEAYHRPDAWVLDDWR
jgi:GNAT superfamily N-acetyltransferase